MFCNFAISHNREYLPANSATVAVFLRIMLAQGYARNTINFAASAINYFHMLSNHPKPTDQDAIISQTKRVITRLAPPPEPKLPVTLSHILAMTFHVLAHSFINTRDIFMLLLMFRYTTLTCSLRNPKPIKNGMET